MSMLGTGPQMVEVPCCSSVNLLGGCDMWDLLKDVVRGGAPHC